MNRTRVMYKVYFKGSPALLIWGVDEIEVATKASKNFNLDLRLYLRCEIVENKAYDTWGEKAC